MKAYRGTKVWFHSLTSALDGGGWSASHPGRITAVGEEGIAEPIAKENVCPRACLIVLEKRKNVLPVP
jgi:hypothetical protein